jgi:hypothetical protein
MSKSNRLDDLLNSLDESQAKSLTPTQKFLHFYRELQKRVDVDGLPEAEYEKLFEALARRAGFDDPLDALEALAQLPARRTPTGSRAA